MSVQDRNKQIVGRYFDELWTKGNVSIVDELCVDDVLCDYPLHGTRRGKAAVKDMLAEFREAFPNASFHSYGPYPMIADDNFVVVRWIGGGTHTGPAFHGFTIGSLESANTRKEIQFTGTSIFTLRDGKIVEETGEEGSLAALKQLGFFSPS